ncbi:flavodoxin family protein [Desulfohalovibrio reitneri]|uniref:flavodoxin family protein n=1 Tax=Desulfohalovibrio reitneri TaxID=1307759 RepID=UPI0004A75F2E|nr:flavodoxin family protein [Desulfohalovibrio reitneri]
MSDALILAGSPRAGGNSDAAARAMAEGVESAGGSARVVHLRSLDVMPCRGCYGCRRDLGGRCVLPDSSGVVDVYEDLMRAPMVAFASPIFFYHMPGVAKTFVDRSQPWYLRWMEGDGELRSLPRRTAPVALVAGRPTGEKLFDGLMLTLKYWLVTFNIVPAEPLALRGKDQPGDLEADAGAMDALREYGRKGWLGLL